MRIVREWTARVHRARGSDAAGDVSYICYNFLVAGPMDLT